MKNLWNKYLRSILLIYCGLYTIATIANSVLYLLKGINEDPAGNWHEIDRAVLVLIVVAAYALIRYVKGNRFFLKALIVYFPTVLLVLLYVYLRGLTAELAKTAYRDVIINYTAGFVIVAVIVCVANRLRSRKQ